MEITEKILVTGSAGFIGKHLMEKLGANDYDAFGLDICTPNYMPPKTIFTECDLLNAKGLIRSVKEIAPDAVVHLAAQTDIRDSAQLNGYAANTEGTKNLIEAIRSTPSIKRAIFTSTQLICPVGDVPSTFDEYRPNTPYGHSKVLMETMVKDWDGGGIEWCIVRPTTVWGPHMSPHYQQMLKLIQKGHYFHCGRGSLLKSYAYVHNLTHQYRKLLTASKEAIHRRTFYLADYEPISLRAYADAFARELNAPAIPNFPLPLVKGLALIGDCLNSVGWRSFPFNSFRLRNILTEYVFDLAATKKVCGPLPFTWEQGVTDTAHWFREMANS